MAVINLELPILLLYVGAILALLIWLVGTFTRHFKTHRYRASLGVFMFSLSGLMGFVCGLRLEALMLGDWLMNHSIAWLIGIAYLGYFLFGFLGCWTAIRLAARFDRKHTLKQLYSALAVQQEDGRSRQVTQGSRAEKQ